MQQLCPASSQRLGNHRAPIKVTIGEKKEEIFLCCQGCLKKKINPQHWATVHGNLAKAQHIGPIMKKPLPQSAKWTIVDRRVVYACCLSCTDKIATNPKTFLTAIDSLFVESLAQRDGTK